MTEPVDPTPIWITAILVGHQTSARQLMERFRLEGYDTRLSVSAGHAGRSYGPELGLHEVFFCTRAPQLEGLRLNEIGTTQGFWDREDATMIWEIARRMQLMSAVRPKPNFALVLRDEAAQRYAQAL